MRATKRGAPILVGVVAAAAMFSIGAREVAAVTGAKRVVERVNLSSSGAQATDGGGTTMPMAFSADGRFVAFVSATTNLVTGDTNGATDIFVRDRLSGSTERVSVSSAGAQGDGGSGSPQISADGRFVVFD